MYHHNECNLNQPCYFVPQKYVVLANTYFPINVAGSKTRKYITNNVNVDFYQASNSYHFMKKKRMKTSVYLFESKYDFKEVLTTDKYSKSNTHQNNERNSPWNICQQKQILPDPKYIPVFWPQF